jgi:hypothetical protein
MLQVSMPMQPAAGGNIGLSLADSYSTSSFSLLICGTIWAEVEVVFYPPLAVSSVEAKTKLTLSASVPVLTLSPSLLQIVSNSH